MNSLFITLEGIDGSGKSLLARGLQKELIARGYDVLLTKEPGGSNIGSQIRDLLQTQESPLCAKTEFLLFGADRAQHVAHTIKPALRDGKIVISDRFAASSLAYQGYGRGLDIAMIEKVNAWAIEDCTPDLELYIDLDVETALARVCKRQETLTAFEKEKALFWHKVQAGYQAIFKESKTVYRLDGKLTPNEVLVSAIEKILIVLRQRQQR